MSQHRPVSPIIACGILFVAQFALKCEIFGWKINGMMETNILKVIKGLSNLKLNGSKNHGLIPIIVETDAVIKEIFLLGYKTNNKIKLAKVKKQADRIFEVKPSSVR